MGLCARGVQVRGRFYITARPRADGRGSCPAASTYVQYREWKRNIRDHAAIQIQAFYRGSALRGKLHDVQQKLSGEESNSENKLSAVNHRRVGPCRVSSASLRLSLSRPGRRAPDLSTIVLPHCAAGDVDDGADLSGRCRISHPREKDGKSAAEGLRRAILR